MSQHIEIGANRVRRTAPRRFVAVVAAAVVAAALLSGNGATAEAQQSASMTVSVMVQPSCRVQVLDAPGDARPPVTLNCSGQATLARPVVVAEPLARSAVKPTPERSPQPAAHPPSPGAAGRNQAAPSAGVVVNF